MKLLSLCRIGILATLVIWSVFACYVMVHFAMDMKEAYADTNVRDVPISFGMTRQTSTDLSVQMESKESEDRSETATAAWKARLNATTQHLVEGAVLGEVVGATSHLESLQQSAFLPRLERAQYPYEVYYTVSESRVFTRQASMWGIPTNTLHSLNPGYEDTTVLEPGTRLLVLRRSDYTPLPYSVGSTNRGRLLNGWLMPEGDETSGYFLRTERSRSWATENTITSLMAGFKAYADKYPGAPRVNVGDFSKRRGGKITPHASHTSGRDVDIGFVHTVAPDARHPEHFTRASSSNVDAEKTWYVLKSIIQTGEVKVIYLDISVQKQLYQIAKEELNSVQMEAIFSIPKRKHSSSAIFQHWPGHKNHAHIRFICPEDEPRCRR